MLSVVFSDKNGIYWIGNSQVHSVDWICLIIYVEIVIDVHAGVVNCDSLLMSRSESTVCWSSKNTSPALTRHQKEIDLNGISHLSYCHIVQFTHTHTHNRFTALLGFVWDYLGEPTPGREGKTSIDLLEQEIVSASGISWAMCKSAPWPRHISMPASHHSVSRRH